MAQQLDERFGRYLRNFQFIGVMDVVEILIITVLVYYVILWFKNTRAWFLLRGVFVLAVCLLVATIFQMDTILWIARNVFQIAAIGFVVALQPELRAAMEHLGQKNWFSRIFPLGLNRQEEGLFSDRTIREVSRACNLMSSVKTGALIVVRQMDDLTVYEKTGIEVDGIVTSQLLVNIFEKNTPLHDGAVIIRGDRVTYATCYLPLSENMNLSKDLGTRHRAAVGISEATDSMTVVVSEETGNIRVAYRGNLTDPLNSTQLEGQLRAIQNKPKKKERSHRKERRRE